MGQALSNCGTNIAIHNRYRPAPSTAVYADGYYCHSSLCCFSTTPFAIHTLLFILLLERYLTYFSIHCSQEICSPDTLWAVSCYTYWNRCFPVQSLSQYSGNIFREPSILSKWYPYTNDALYQPAKSTKIRGNIHDS